SKSKSGRWDEKFASRGSDLLPAEPFLLRNAHLLKPGSLLDFACGDGRNAIPLAINGFAVTCVDFSAVALGRLRRFAEQARLSVRLVEMDLEAQDSFLTLGSFDNIVVSHFMPPALFWAEVHQLLTPGGNLIFCTFNLK